MLLELGTGGLLLGAAAVFAGGYARGYSGFGSSAIVVAAMTLILPPHQVVPIAVLLEVSAGLIQIPGIWRSIDWRLLGFILLGAVLATPIGTTALLLLDPTPLRIGILLFILLVSLILLTGKTLSNSRSWPIVIVAGAISGFANGAAALAGLPAALFLAASDARAATMRATLILYISAIGIVTGVLLAKDGHYDATTLNRILAALPFLIVGLWLGGRRFGNTSPQSFKKFTLVMLIGIATVGLIRSLA